MSNIDEKALFNVTLGLYVIGSYEKNTERPVGCIADAVMQVSANPVQFAISLDKKIYTKKCIDDIGELSISILSKETSSEVLSEFGFKSSKDTNKWDTVPFNKDGNLPLLKDCIATITCNVKEKIDDGDHCIFICDAVNAVMVRKGEPLTYAQYRKDKIKYSAKQSVTKRWVCSVCGYEYDGDIPFEQLSDDWKCPCCQKGKEYFHLQ